MVAWLRRERDKLRQTTERLCSELSTTREERNEARQGVSSLRADLGATVAQRLEVESVSAGLGTELAEVRGILQAKSVEHDLLRAGGNRLTCSLA